MEHRHYYYGCISVLCTRPIGGSTRLKWHIRALHFIDRVLKCNITRTITAIPPRVHDFQPLEEDLSAVADKVIIPLVSRLMLTTHGSCHCLLMPRTLASGVTSQDDSR